MSDNTVKIDYSFPEFPPQTIDAAELERLQKLDKNIQAKIYELKDFVFEAEALIKSRVVTKKWLEEAIADYENEIRKLEILYK